MEAKSMKVNKYLQIILAVEIIVTVALYLV